MESIYFFNENIRFTLKDKKKIRSWIRTTVLEYHFVTGDINFVFCDDDYLSNINVKYLKHNTLTDIITFSLSNNKDILSGDIYISIPRVKENAEKFKVAFENELHRVIIHGILHLIGFNDSTQKEKSEIRKREDLCLSMLG
jgi:probable rRNA maturation factor